MTIHRRTAIGLDLGPRWITAVQLSGRPERGWRLEATARIGRATSTSIVPTADEMGRTWDVLDRRGFSGRRMVVVAPLVHSATLELPPRSSGAPVDDLARQEVARSLKLEVPDIEVALWDVPRPPRGGDGTFVLAVGLPHKESGPLLDALEDAGATVEALDCRCCAMARSCAAQVDAGAGVTGLIDVEDAAISIAVMNSGVVVYDRVVRDAGLDRLRTMIRDGLGGGTGAPTGEDAAALDLVMDSILSPNGVELPDHVAGMVKGVVAEYTSQVVQELRSVMAYSIHRYPGQIGPVLMMGSGARIRELGERIRTELDLATRMVGLSDVTRGACAADNQDGATGGEFLVAAGLAMRPRVAAMARRAA